MNSFMEIFREVASTQPDGIVTVTEIVDCIIAENGGSREYLERKVRSHVRVLRTKGNLVAMKKRIPTVSGGTTLVDAYKEKAAR
jgi:hypothetical protein